MLRFDGQDIATDRLCLFRFVERAIEFSLRDGLSNPSCRNALNLIFHGSSPPCSIFSGAVNVANRALFPSGNSTNAQIGSQLRPDPTPASNALRWAPAVHDSRLPLRLLLSS